MHGLIPPVYRDDTNLEITLRILRRFQVFHQLLGTLVAASIFVKVEIEIEDYQ